MKPLSKTFLIGLAFAWGGLGVLSGTVDLANGLVGHWSFDEVNGTTVKDSSGNDRHGTLVNMDSATDYVDGKVNKAIDLDGSNDYVSIPHSAAVDIRRTISVSLWVNFNQLPPNVASMIYKGNGVTESSNGRTYSFWAYPDGHLHLTSSDGSQQSSDTTPGIVSTGSWHHLVALIDRSSGNFKTYSNNVLVSSHGVRTSDTVSNSQPLRFGKCLEDHNYLNAKLDEVRLYDRILNTDEITYLYTSTTTDTDSDGLTDAEEINLGTNSSLVDTDGDGVNDGQEVSDGTSPTDATQYVDVSRGLIGHWSFDEVNGTNAADSSGNGYDATLFNADSSSAWVEGKVNGGIELDGTDDYLAIQTLNYNQAGQIPAVTVAAWVKTSASSQRYVISYDRSEYWRFTVGGYSNNGKMFFATTDSRGYAPETSDDYGQTVVTDNAWHLVVASYDSTTSLKKFYVDGVGDGSSSVHGNRALGSGTSRFGTIGTTNEDTTFNSGSRGSFFQGTLDEIRLYDRALTDAEIAYLYSSATTDTDSDGLTDAEEANLGTNSALTDTDGDGISDGDEVNGYKTYSNVGPGSYSWDAAKSDAEARGGHLATITSSSEQATVQALVSGTTWLGGSDAESEGSFKWVTGEAWTYSNFNPGEPNNSGNQDYVQIYTTGKWDDHAGPMANYILERVLKTNPVLADTDGDGFRDNLEKTVGSDPTQTSSTPLDVGLTAYYPFTGNANDSGGNNYHGTVTGATLTTDRFGNANQAYSFDGSNDYISLGDVLDPGSNAVTVAMWFKWGGNGPGSSEYMLFNKETLYELHVSPEGFAEYAFKPYWVYVGENFSVQINQWKHVAVTYDKSTQRLYEDGQEVYSRSQTGDIGTNSEPFYFGRRSMGRYFNGSIDDARIYFRALSAEEITGLYAAEMSTNSSPSDLTLSSSGIAENQSAGAEVGSFAPTDPDDSNGSGTYVHTLVDGNGSTDNSSFTLETNGTLNTAAVFDYETKTAYSIRVRVADEHNASYEEAFTISVTDLDDTAPVITLVGSATVTHEAATSYSDAGATWTDAVDGNGSATVSGTVDVSVPGSYTLTYSKTDAVGNAATQVTRTVTVQDTTVPVISLSGDANVTHEAATVYADGGAAWTDTLDGNGSLVAVGSVNENAPGAYVLTYDITDVAGNAADQITRTVTVVDTTKPVISLAGDAAVTHEAATSYSDAGATWTDTLDGNGTLVASGTVNVNVPGAYFLTYDFTDAAGNAADQVTRTVTVVDTTKPVISLTGDAAVTHEAATPYTDDGSTWTDTLDGNGTLDTNGTVNPLLPGAYPLAFGVTDAAGNAADQVTRTVTVVDTTKPVISLEGNATIRHRVWRSYLDPGARASDTLDGNLTNKISTINPVDASIPGSYEVSYAVSDSAGNAATVVTRSVVVFNEAPSGLLLSNASVEENLPSGTLIGTFSTEDPDDADGSKSYLYVKVSGNGLTVGSDGVLRTSEAFDFESSSSHEIVVRTTDEFGASLEKTFTISVIDAFVPGVDTAPATSVTGTSSGLNGSIADAGDSQGVTERGFVFGRSPDPETSDGSTLAAGAGSGSFTASTTDLTPGRVYYFKAYARNAEGISYGSQERFTTPQDRSSALWSDATASGANWRSSDWFGSFYLTDTPWLYHGELGWLYASGTSSSSVWLWTESLGWVWTGKETFPYLYRNADTGWYHWNGTVNGRFLFYRYSDSQWIDFPLGGNAEAYK
jgi:hypothetical protein